MNFLRKYSLAATILRYLIYCSAMGVPLSCLSPLKRGVGEPIGKNPWEEPEAIPPPDAVVKPCSLSVNVKHIRIRGCSIGNTCPHA